MLPFERFPKNEPVIKKDASRSPSLYSVIEHEGRFVATLPSLINDEGGYIAGSKERTFDTREEADEAVLEAQKDVRERFELHSLRKTFTSTYYRIEPQAEGGFLVTIPATYASRRGRFVGTATIICDTWDEAKNTYLNERKKSERLTHAPIIDIRLSENARIAFSDFAGFDPAVAPGAETVAVPPEIQKVLMTPEQMKGGESAMSYHKTLEREHWADGIFVFIGEYVKKEGKGLLQELGIKSLEHLSPKQAIDLSTRIVLNLTKYYVREDLYRDAKTGRGLERTEHDKKDVLELLEEGLRRKNDPTWEGNGVCRNFASMVKAVFEALKARQGRFTRLNNVHCLYEARKDTFEPTRENWMEVPSSTIGHAWNTFVTLNASGEAHAVIADVTWAKRDLKTGKIEHLDQTLTRMEPFVVQSLNVSTQSRLSTHEKNIEREKALSYYLLQIERLSSSAAPFEKQQVPFFVSRCVEILSHTGELTLPMSKRVLSAIEDVYKETADTADRSEIEGLWKISQQNHAFDFSHILTKYLTSDVGDVRRLLFDDDRLQRFVFDMAPDRAGMLERLSTAPSFRVRMREVQPVLFGPFDPINSKEDASELVYLLQRDSLTERLAAQVKSGRLDEAVIKTVFSRMRQELRKINPESYDSRVARMKDYEILKNIATLRRGLSAKS